MKTTRAFLVVSLIWMSAAHAQTAPDSPDIDTLRKAAISAQFTDKKPAEAIELWSRLLQLKPDDNQALRLRGSAYGETGQHDLAERDGLRATELEPSNRFAWGGLCWSRILANRPLEARPACEKGVSLGANSMAVTVNLGHTYLLQGDKATAQHWYQKTLPLIDSENDLKEGPLADFDLFISKGWQVETSKVARTWFDVNGTAWLTAKSLLQRAEKADDTKDYAQALALHEQRLRLLISLFGERDSRVEKAHDALVDTRNHLADQLYAKGNYADALTHFQQVLTYREVKDGPKSRNTASSLNDVALTQVALRQYTEAEPLFIRALAIRENVFGPEHYSTAISLNNLAYLYNAMGQYAKAEPLYVRALAIKEKTDGPEDTSTATSLNNLAALYDDMGQYTKAEPLYVRALAIREKALGLDHPDTATSLSNLAYLYKNMGQRAKAEQFYVRALAIREKTFGSEHPDTATTLNNLAQLYYDMGQYAKAEAFFVRALNIREKAIGPDHPDTAASLNDLAALYQAIGRYAKAEPLYVRTLAIKDKTLGPEHPGTALSLNNLADVYRAMGQYTKAEPFYVRSLTISEKTLGPEHPDTATKITSLGVLYQDMGQYAKAEPLNVRALAIREKAFGPDHPRTAASFSNLGRLYFLMGQYPKAESLIVRVLAITEKFFGSEHPNAATSFYNVARLYQEMGQYAKAEQLVIRSLGIREKTLGPEHPGTAASLNNLADLYRVMGQYAKAEPLYVRAIDIKEKALGSEHPSTATSLNGLAKLYDVMGERTRAQPLYDRAYRIALNAGEPRLAWIVQGNLSDFHAKTSPDLAIFYGKQAINTLQTVRGNLKELDKDIQKSFLGTVEKNYQKLADLLIAQGRLPEAQQVLAMLKEDEYYDFIRRDASADARSTRASFTGQEAPWDARLQAAGGRLTALGAEAQALRKKKEQGADLSIVETQRLSDLETELETAGAAFIQVLDELQRAFADVSDKTRYAELEKKGIDNDLTDVVASFGPDVALLQYIVMPEGTHVLLTTGATRLARKANVPQAELNQAVNALLATLRSPGQDPRAAAQKLYGHLISPVEDDLRAMKAKTLMLSLDGVLRYVPMAALHDGEQYLAQRYALALYTDAARERLKDKPQSIWKVAGLGVTQAKEGFAALPAVREELNALVRTAESKGVLPGVVILDEKFTSGSFKEKLRERYPVLHIASHFQFDPAGDTASFLLLGDGSRLSLNEIRKNGYSFAGVDLMTLSACQTGVGGGKDANGREIEGLGVLAQKQGAKGVIATLWPVADTSTAQLMQSFYRLREEQKLTKAEALRQAQLALLSGRVGAGGTAERGGRVRTADGQQAVAFVPDPNAPFAHPYYWAPFILMGNWL